MAQLSNWLKRLMDQSIHGVCKVVYEDRQGTGAFYEVIDKEHCKRSLFITCYHVAKIDSCKQIFNDLKIYPNIGDETDNFPLKFKKKHVLLCWKEPDFFDATVVELNEKGKKYFLDKNVSFLSVCAAKANSRVAILQCPGGQSMFAYGNLTDIINSEVFYKIATAPGSSGAPVVDINCEAVAIHNSGDQANAKTDILLIEQPDLLRKATSLQSIITAYLYEKKGKRLSP